MEGNTSVARYVWFFTATNVGVILLIGVVGAILEIDPGSGPSIFGLFASTGIALHAFVKDHQREPTKAERTRLVRWSFVAYLILTFVLIALLLALPGPLLPRPLPEEAGMGGIMLVFLIGAGIAALVVYGILVLGYKLFSKQAPKILEKQAEKSG